MQTCKKHNITFEASLKMVAQFLNVKEVDSLNLSRRNSSYIDTVCEKIFDLPEILILNDNRTVKCVNCFQLQGIPANIIMK